MRRPDVRLSGPPGPESPEDLENLGATVRGLQAAQMTGNRPICITVQPPPFSHHSPAKASSDISGHEGDYVAVVETKYVRWSVRMNSGRLIKGEDRRLTAGY